MLNFSFDPNFMKKCISNAVVNFGFQSDINIFGNPWCLNHPLRIDYAVSNTDAIFTIGTTFANLANHSTITKMTLYVCDFDKLLMKSMHILCHGLSGLGNGCKRLVWFWAKVRFTWHPTKPSKSGIYPSSCTNYNAYLTPFYDRFFLFNERQWNYDIFHSKWIASTCILAHTPDFACN